VSVELLPPFTRGLGFTLDIEPRPTPLTRGPRFVRSKSMSRWHRVRDGVDYGTHIAYGLWCGTTAHLSAHRPQLLTHDRDPVDGMPVCGTCEGRALGAGHDNNEGPRDLLFTPEPRQPTYPFEFIQADALDVLAALFTRGRIGPYALADFDAAHASPVCRDWTSLTAVAGTTGSAYLLVETLRLLRAQRLPFVVENVVGARAALRTPTLLCGSSFGLGVRRHRLFETAWPLASPPPCLHGLQPEPVDVTGTGAARRGRRRDGGGGNSRKPRDLAHAREVMGVDWMTRAELSQAIPPAYTEFIGRQLIQQVREVAA
jgi:DNA (cytosine-5)-methyltransferase 1